MTTSLLWDTVSYTALGAVLAVASACGEACTYMSDVPSTCRWIQHWKGPRYRQKAMTNSSPS